LVQVVNIRSHDADSVRLFAQLGLCRMQAFMWKG
jgi:hypothetical protein